MHVLSPLHYNADREMCSPPPPIPPPSPDGQSVQPARPLSIYKLRIYCSVFFRLLQCQHNLYINMGCGGPSLWVGPPTGGCCFRQSDPVAVRGDPRIMVFHCAFTMALLTLQPSRETSPCQPGGERRCSGGAEGGEVRIERCWGRWGVACGALSTMLCGKVRRHACAGKRQRCKLINNEIKHVSSETMS